MRQCHYCGKILHELPYTCRRCGHIFCSDHHLPENHQCAGHHHHEHKPHYRLCENCSHALTGLPFTCHRCGMFLCEQCHLPENHRCVPINSDTAPVWTSSVSQNSGKSTINENTVKSRTSTKPGRSYWNKFKENITLKNFTILSVILIIISFIPIFVPSFQNKEIFQLFFGIGFVCLIISYFFYAVDHWRAQNIFLALIMVMVPLLASYFSSFKIQNPSNIFYFIILFGIYVIISAILLFIGEKIFWGIQKYLLKTKNRNHWFSLPKTSYAILGMICVSFIIINSGSVSVFSDNLNIVTQSISGSMQNAGYGSTSSVPTPAQYPSYPTISQYITVTVTETKPSIISPISIPTKNLETGVTSRSFAYILRGKTGSINTNLYSGVNNEILSRPSPVWCIRYNHDSSSCTSEETRQYLLKYLDDPDQKKYLVSLVNSIKTATPNKEDQARIAISLVQNIPYDYSKLNSLSTDVRFPYRVLYENTGICEEKSLLLAYLLRELGYGVVLFEFKSENHMALGVKSPAQYSYKNSGYAFIESTTPSIITDSQGDYVGAGKLTSTPQIFQISDGSSMTSISEEYQDSISYNQLGTGRTLAPVQYKQWEMLVWKYGLIMSDGTTVTENPSNKPLCDNNGILCNGECYDSCETHMIGKCTSSGVICEYEPNYCPPGLISCNGKCWQMCYGSTPQCTAQGLVCYH
jgi:hypothetical protein